MKSIIHTRGYVPFPEFTAERAYMVGFKPAEGLPTHLSRWARTVEAMLHDIEAPGEVDIMIDQAEVRRGLPHRRGGPHIDGNWLAGVKAHGGSTHGQPDPPRPHHGQLVGSHGAHGPIAGRWGGGDGGQGDPGWGQGGGGDAMGSHGHSGRVTNGVWRSEHFAPELLVLASDVGACVAYVGEVDGDPMVGGDCAHLDLSGLERRPLEPHVAHVGNVTMIHESVPVAQTCRRTLVRLNVPGGILRAA